MASYSAPISQRKINDPSELEAQGYPDLTNRIARREGQYPAHSGGFSDIYIGFLHENPSIEVAIKVLRVVDEKDQIEIARTRLNREAVVWHRLRHPNILSFLGLATDLGRLDNCPALISPYCRNGTSSEYLQRSNAPIEERLRLILGVARGLEYLHKEGVIHGALEPSNILIDDNYEPLLCGFGRSSILDVRGFTSRPSGAIRYQALELALGEVSPNKSTDVCAFGLTAFELWTGLRPYAEIRNEPVVTKQIIMGTAQLQLPNPPPAMADELWPILVSCLNSEPKARPDIPTLVQKLESCFFRLCDAPLRALDTPLKGTSQQLQAAAGGIKDFEESDEEPVQIQGIGQDSGITGDSQMNPQLIDQNSGLVQAPEYSANLAQVWPFVSTALDRIVSGSSYDAYQLRAVVRDFVGYIRDEKPQELEHFYSKLEDYFHFRVRALAQQKVALSPITYCKELVTELLQEAIFAQLSGLDLLQSYLEEWRVYEISVRQLELPFSHWDRYWIQQQREEGNIYLHDSQKLALLHWKIGFLESVQGTDLKLTEAVLDLLKQQRNGKRINKDLPQQFIDSLLALAFDYADPLCQCLVFYLDDFEGPFLRSTMEYYSAWAAAFLERYSAMDYLKYVEDLLEEEKLIALYLPETRHQCLFDACGGALIASKADLLCTEFEKYLARDDSEHLRRIFSIMSRTADGRGRLLAVFEKYVREVALAAVARLKSADSGGSPSDNPVSILLSVRDHNLDRAARLFNNATTFSQCVSQVFQQIFQDHPEWTQEVVETNPQENQMGRIKNLEAELGEDDFPQFFNEIDGRLYHSSETCSYPLPVDTLEQERLNTFNTLLPQVIGANYVGPVSSILAPNSGHRARVLDLCTGTGTWLMAMAEEFPHVQFTGIDIVPIATRYPSDNVDFEVGDISEALRWPDATFDFVHARSISMAVRDYPTILPEVIRVMRPGGLYLSGELELSVFSHSESPQTSDSPPTASSISSNFFQVLQAALQTHGLRPQEREIPTFLQRSGAFHTIEPKTFFFPIGAWHDNPETKQLGRAFQAIYWRFADSVKPLLLQVGHSKEYVDALMQDFHDDLDKTRGLFGAYHVVHATKFR